MTSKAQATKEKVNKLDITKIENFCAAKGHHQESEKTTHRMGENICKSYTYLIRDLDVEYIKDS